LSAAESLDVNSELDKLISLRLFSDQYSEDGGISAEISEVEGLGLKSNFAGIMRSKINDMMFALARRYWKEEDSFVADKQRQI